MRQSATTAVQLFRLVTARNLKYKRLEVVQQLGAEFFASTESSLSNSRGNAHEPQWLKDMFADLLRDLVDVVSDHERHQAMQLAPESREQEASPSAGISYTTHALVARAEGQNDCDLSGTSEMNARPNMTAMVEWCVGRGWGSTGVLSKKVKVKTNGTLSGSFSQGTAASTEPLLGDAAESRVTLPGSAATGNGTCEDGGVSIEIERRTYPHVDTPRSPVGTDWGHKRDRDSFLQRDYSQQTGCAEDDAGDVSGIIEEVDI